MADKHSLSAQSEAPPPKRRQPPPTHDRLSELPEFILHDILSHLFIHEAAKTSILSKRFASLWNFIPTLKFSDVNCNKFGEDFVAFVNTALSLHRRIKFDGFSLTFRYNLPYKNSVDKWIDFALQKEVKRLNLNFPSKSSRNFPGIVYDLPNTLYNNDNLIELITCRCKFSFDASINWSSLRKLSITRVRLNKKFISRVLRACPVLETLELKEWSGIDKVKITSVSLKTLRIIEEQCPRYIIGPQDDILFEVSGPNLVELEVSGSLYRTRVRVSNVGSLVSATMDFEVKPQLSGTFVWTVCWYVMRDQDIVRDVLGSLCFVKSLTVGGWCIKCALVHGSSDSCDKEYYWKSWSTISRCPVLHLKKVKVIGFRDTCRSMKPLFQFLEFLLRNSGVLEEIIIQASKHVTQSLINEALKLLDVPTASPDVVVQFEPPHLWVDILCMYQKLDPL